MDGVQDVIEEVEIAACPIGLPDTGYDLLQRLEIDLPDQIDLKAKYPGMWYLQIVASIRHEYTNYEDLLRELSAGCMNFAEHCHEIGEEIPDICEECAGNDVMSFIEQAHYALKQESKNLVIAMLNSMEKHGKS